MNLTLITGYFEPEKTADVHLNHDIAYGLSESGINVTVVTPFPNRGISREEQKEYTKLPCVQINDSLKIIRVGKPKKYKNSLTSRGFYLLGRTVELFQVAKRVDTDVFLVVSTPPFLGYVAALLSKKAPVIYKLQDVFPDSLMATKGISSKSLSIRVLKRLEKWVYSKCDRITVDSDDIKKTISGSRVDEKKITVVYDWIDVDKYVPIEFADNKLFDKYNISRDTFKVCYAGNIGKLQDVELIVDAANIIQEKYPDIIFLIIGNGSYEGVLDKHIRDTKNHNIIRLPMQSSANSHYAYGMGNVNLVSLAKGVTEIALPSKIWSIMASGRASILSINPNSALGEMIISNGCGICTSPGSSKELAEAIIYYYLHPKEVDKAARKAREYVEDKMTKQRAIKQFLDIIYDTAK